MNGRLIGVVVMVSTIGVLLMLFVVHRKRTVRRLRRSSVLAVIRLGPEERRRLVWLDFARRNDNLSWIGYLGLSFTGSTLALLFLNALGLSLWTRENEFEGYFVSTGLGGLAVWALWMSVLLLRAWCVTEVTVYYEGVRLGGELRTWADLKHVMFDEPSSELRFYDECTDYGGEFSTKYFDVLRIPIAKGQKIQAHRVIESLARVANSAPPSL